MIKLNSFADSRLIRGCIFCGGRAETRDHIPSKCLLDRPYPENLVIVGCCYECNQSFSSDEEYFACFIECVSCGSTDPVQLNRISISKTLQNSPNLRKRIEESIVKIDGKSVFTPEQDRINNVMLKLAKGHVAYELDLIKRDKPDYFWCGLLTSLPEEYRIDFNAAHVQENVGEVGSRSMQRSFVTNLSITDNNGKNKDISVLINDWVDVQDKRYRYIAIDDKGIIIIRIVIDEFFACEIAWEN